MSQTGSIVCVGLGMRLGAHISPLSRSYIENADVVFAGVSDGIVEKWLEDMHPEVHSLQPYYQEGKSRLETYRQMVDAMMKPVRDGKKVCGAFYGHPGVFAWAPHKVIEQARAEGFQAHMEPGISAEDCLYADLGIDPGTFGCQHYEASQLLFYKRNIDPSAYLVVWQAGVAGDRQLKTFSSDEEHLKILVDVLTEFYPSEHKISVYEAATLPLQSPRIDAIAIADLPNIDVHMHTTLAIPPARPMEKNLEALQKLSELNSVSSNV